MGKDTWTTQLKGQITGHFLKVVKKNKKRQKQQ